MTLLLKASYYDYDANKLVTARGSRSQTQVAQDLGIAQVTLSRVETKQNASYELVERLCSYYGLDPSDVLREVPAPEGAQPQKNFLKNPTRRVKIA